MGITLPGKPGRIFQVKGVVSVQFRHRKKCVRIRIFHLFLQCWQNMGFSSYRANGMLLRQPDLVSNLNSAVYHMDGLDNFT